MADAPLDLVPTIDPEQSERLMVTIDGLNGRFGRGTIRPGTVRPVSTWTTRANNRSPRYTTRPTDLMAVRA